MKEKSKFFGWKSTKKCLVSIHILRVVFLTLGLWYRQGLSSGYTGYTYAWVLWACSIDPWFRGVSMLQAIDMKGGGGGLYSYSQNKYLGQTLDFVRNSVLHGNSLISIFQKIFLVLEKVLSRGGEGVCIPLSGHFPLRGYILTTSKIHCVKRIRIRIRSISPYSVRMRENAGKVRTRITPNTDTFCTVINWASLKE